MTNAMPIFINSLFPISAGENMETEAKKFIEDARKAIALAEKEANFAAIAFAQINTESESPNLKLAEIARWHYVQTIKYYGEAVAILEQAAKLWMPEKHKKYIELKTKKCLEEMACANTRKIELGTISRIQNKYRNEE